jgi:ankyrin repeat protein
MSSKLHRCAESGNLDRVKDVVEGGANVEELDSKGRTALLLASLRGNFEHHANVAQSDRTGMTPLRFASWGGPRGHFLGEILVEARCEDHREK